MKIRCKKCGHVWEYKGSAYYATCPNCHTKNNVAKQVESEEVVEEERPGRWVFERRILW